MKALRTVVAVSFAISAGSVFAQSGADVVKSKGCLNCHAVDTKKVGPSFKDIAAKQQGKADAMVAQIKNAKGHPKVSASEAEIKAAVSYILSVK
jgi:cytochrome c